MSIYSVNISVNVQKQLLKLPIHIITKLHLWIFHVNTNGLSETRKIPGFHDELLQGKRFGQRSIRLNRSYRAIYKVVNGDIEFIEIIEVTKHVY